MNKKINYGSLEELQAIDARKELDSMSLGARKGLIHNIVQRMEEYDPGGKRAHELAKKYRQKEEGSG